MTDVFISYSRRDKDFVTRLHGSLAEKGRDTWVDWEDIPLTADWWKEIQGGIEQADAFVFIISPDSIRSDVCRQEIEYALANNKRFIPLLLHPITQAEDQKRVHSAINSHNWIFFREQDDFQKAFQSLVDALDTDLSNTRAHTRILVRAHEWDANKRNPSFLFQGDNLKEAEMWLAQAVGKKPAPTPLHAAFIAASRQRQIAQQRRLLVGVTAALVVSVALALLSLALFGEANTQRSIAVNNASTATVALGQAERNAATATVARGQAERNAATAVAAQQEVELQATEVSRERYNAQSIAVAGQAQVELDNPRPELGQERAVQLALEALDIRYTWQAERALALAVQSRLEQRGFTGHANEVTGVDWSPNFQGLRLLLTSSNDWTARLWDLQGNQLAELAGHTAAISRALWSPDTRLTPYSTNLIATASLDGTVRIWRVLVDANNAATVEPSFILQGHDGRILNLEWEHYLEGQPYARRLVTASEDGTAIIWDATSGQQIQRLSGHQDIINYAHWSPPVSGQAYTPRIVTASDDSTAIIWDMQSGALLLNLAGHRSAVGRAQWSPDGTRVVTGSADNTAIIWNAATGESVFTLVGHIRRITRVRWSPDGSRIVTISADGTAKIWDSSSGQLLRTLFGHENDINDVQWSPGGNRLITVSQDGTARIWQAESGGELLVFRSHEAGTSIFSLDWSPDGNYFVSAGEDGTAQLWQIWRNPRALISFAQRCCVTRSLTDEENIQFSLPTATPAFTPTPAPASCPATSVVTRLYPGARGRVIQTDNVSVRESPGISFDRIGRVAPGQTFQVIEGPMCADDMAWFEIIYGISAIRGWVAEGRDGEYFVEPVR